MSQFCVLEIGSARDGVAMRDTVGWVSVGFIPRGLRLGLSSLPQGTQYNTGGSQVPYPVGNAGGPQVDPVPAYR